MSSLLSLSGPRTPKLNRKSRDNDKTVTIKCQRLNSERQYEEVEVEVPAPIYDTLRFYNSESSASSGLDTTSSRGSRQSDKHDYNLNKNRTFSAKIRSLFGSRTWNIKRFIMKLQVFWSQIGQKMFVSKVSGTNFADLLGCNGIRQSFMSISDFFITNVLQAIT